MRKKTIWASQPSVPVDQSPLVPKIPPNPDIRALVPDTLIPPAVSQASPSLASSRQAHLDLLWSAFRGSPNIQSQSAAMKNAPRHNLKSRKTEKTEEAAPPEKNSPLIDAIAAWTARPRGKKMVHSCRYNWRHYTCKTRSWNVSNASKKVDGCPGGAYILFYP